jgi:hypothetical protein
MMMAAVGQVREVPVNVSDVLPANLAVFVEAVGSDRRLEALTAEELELLRDPELDPGGFVELLCPVSTTEAEGPMTLVDVRGPLGAGTWAVTGPGTVVENGIDCPAGERFWLGQTLTSGAVFNAGETVLVFQDQEGNGLEIPPGGVLMARCAMSCGTGCSSGLYACCTITGGCAYCSCIKNGTKAACDAGGVGSTWCTIDTGSTYVDPDGEHEAE